MTTVDEILSKWKTIRSALGNLICDIDGKTQRLEKLKDLEHSWQLGYDCGHQDGIKVGVASVDVDARNAVKSKWEKVEVEYANGYDLQIASMRCGNCNRWHSEVYHYGNPIEFAYYCPFCGASMREEKE